MEMPSIAEVLKAVLEYRAGLIKEGIPQREVMEMTIGFQGSFMMAAMMRPEADPWDKGES